MEKIPLELLELCEAAKDKVEILEKKQDDIEVYLEPKFCSDIVVVYLDRRFHLHRCTLARDSIYFRTMLETDNELKQIDLVSIQDLSNHTITTQQMYWFFQLLYNKDLLSGPEPSRVQEKDDPSSEKLLWLNMVHLAHYFNVAWLESKVQTHLMQFVKARQQDGSNIFYLNTALRYNWSVIQPDLLNIIARNLHNIKTHSKFDLSDWQSLPAKIRESLLEEAVAHLGKTQAHRLVPGTDKHADRKVICACGFNHDTVEEVLLHVKLCAEP